MTWKLIRHFDSKSIQVQGAGYMQGPVALNCGNLIRVYYAARDFDGKSFPTYFELDINNLDRIIYIHKDSIIPRGPCGTFDDDGIMPACALQVDENIWMYYSGWNRRITIPYHNTTGLAISEDGGRSFRRMFNGPILDRTPYEPFMSVTPWVIKSDIWSMWYVSGISWIDIDGHLEPTYGIRHAKSIDGITWIREKNFVIPMRHSEEAIARPTVIFKNNTFHMWYSFRNSRNFRDGDGSYRIGYAYSIDGGKWIRADQLNKVPRSGLEWDSHMQCYPYVIDIKENFYMFYNGNSFGKTGIGLAIWEGPLLAK